MSDYYIAWDGRQYPWPPPDNWYLAEDGRWWAPGTGPEPTLGSGLPGPDGGLQSQGEPTAQLAKVQVRTATFDEAPEPVRSSGTSGVLIALLSVLGLVVVVLAAGVAFLVLGSSDGDDTAAVEAAPAAADEPDASGAVADDAGASAEDTAGPSTTVLSSDPRIADFRARLESNELSAEGLGDREIEQFGMDFCDLAGAADDGAMFASVRDEAVAGSSLSDLDAQELAFLIDAAVVTFCPDQAQRLGLAG